MHDSVAVTLVVFPVSLIVVLTGVDHLALAPLHASLPQARVHRPIFVAQLAVAVAHAVLPVTFVLDTFFLVDVFALAVAQAVQNVALVGALVRPRVRAFPCDLVLFEFAAVHCAIGPLEDSAAPEETQAQLALVLVAVLKLARSVPVVDVANLTQIDAKVSLVSDHISDNKSKTYLSILLIVDSLAGPVLDDELGQLRRQERHFWQGFNLHHNFFLLIIIRGCRCP